MRSTFFLILLTLVAYNYGFAQTSNVIRGLVKDLNDAPLHNVTIRLSTGQRTTTLNNGQYELSNIQSGKVVITAEAAGYQTHTDTLNKESGETLVYDFILYEEANALSEVKVFGKTETQKVREQPIRAVVVDTRAVAEQPVTLAELMNRSPGIRIRQSGGLGNQVDVSINGFQGNSVQYFRDGIPLEYLGGGYGINNVPVNQLERVEVYKGVVPVSLGGDALGGAVNLITKRNVGTTLDLSYELASFNTHIANLSFYRQKQDSKWFYGADAFFNYSDNDYKADVEVPNENANLVPATVRLFHNGYKHYFAEAYAGVKNTGWADEFRIGLAFYDIERESQHPAAMTNPYGATVVNNKGLVPSLRYKKSLLEDRLAIDQFASYSSINRLRTDTIRGTYDWYGNFFPNPNSIGETPRAALSDIDFTNIISRTYLSYQVSTNHKIDFNTVFNLTKRTGSDPYGFRFNGTDIDVLSKESVYNKTIVGLGMESKFLSGKLTNQVFGKYFNYYTKGINAFMANDTDLDKYTSVSNSNWGIGDAIKYQIAENQFIRASAELTNRLPRPEEIFGDNDTRAPNFQLEPEKSFNVNLGYRIDQKKYSVEVGGFYRRTKGMVLLIPIQPPFAQYQNVDSIQGYGFDIDASYQLTSNLSLSGNATWQDLRMIDISTPLYQWTEGSRLRNTPYFFANLSLKGQYSNIFKENDGLKPYVLYNYIREFYLNYIPRDSEPNGFLGLFGSANVDIKNIVPNQHFLNAGATYFFSRQPISLGVEVKNLTDAKLFDFYKIQRPGRSVHVKLTYKLNYI